MSTTLAWIFLSMLSAHDKMADSEKVTSCSGDAGMSSVSVVKISSKIKLGARSPGVYSLQNCIQPGRRQDPGRIKLHDLQAPSLLGLRQLHVHSLILSGLSRAAGKEAAEAALGCRLRVELQVRDLERDLPTARSTHHDNNTPIRGNQSRVLRCSEREGSIAEIGPIGGKGYKRNQIPVYLALPSRKQRTSHRLHAIRNTPSKQEPL